MLSLGKSSKRQNRINLIDKIPTQPSVLPAVNNCKYCGAKRFYLESLSFCCYNGQVRLAPTEMLPELLKLYTANTEDAIECRECIRSYNNMFAFTSLGVHYDKDLSRRNRGIYTFRVQGQMYHFMNPLSPSHGQPPSNVQLYFFDTDHKTSNRMAISPKFKESIIEQL